MLVNDKGNENGFELSVNDHSKTIIGCILAHLAASLGN